VIATGNRRRDIAVSRWKIVTLVIALFASVGVQLGMALFGPEPGMPGKGCPAAGPVGTVGARTAPAGALDVPVIPQRDGRLLINVPDSRMDRAIVGTQQDANDLWRILYGAPYPAGRPTP
jgi:hypothetical protein